MIAVVATFLGVWSGVAVIVALALGRCLRVLDVQQERAAVSAQSHP